MNANVIETLSIWKTTKNMQMHVIWMELNVSTCSNSHPPIVVFSHHYCGSIRGPLKSRLMAHKIFER